MTTTASDPLAALWRELERAPGRQPLMRGGLRLGDRVVDVAALDTPLLDVLAQADHLVPPDSAGPETRIVSATETEEFRMRGGHVGLICGRCATRGTQPEVAEWLARGEASA